jgi:predicted transcriptional regulator
MKISKKNKCNSVKLRNDLDSKLSDLANRRHTTKAFLLGLAVEEALKRWKENGITVRA